MTRLAFGFLIYIFVTSFVDTYGYNDYDVQQNENVMQRLLRILNNNEYNKEKRNTGNEIENWPGHWMPDRPGDPQSPPKVLPNQQQDEYEPETELSQEMDWSGRWMPDRPGDPKPPPKVLPKNQQQGKYESETELSHETGWRGRWMPDRPGNPQSPPKVLPKNQQQGKYESETELSHETGWRGRWMPDRPGDPKPPPKVLPKNKQQGKYESETELSHETGWRGRWMPDRPDDPKPPAKVLPKNEPYEYESIMQHPREYMGHPSQECDDAKTNLTIDWDGDSSAYTCYGQKNIPRIMTPEIYCEQIPKEYKAPHYCMTETIEYYEDIPLYGPHRPLWPVYGEYIYVPPQRWLHNLEHGAIVMLYHPCANPLEVERLRDFVKKCLWRHVITPYSYLDENRPLALLSWGCRLTMSYVNPAVVKNFIRKNALRGPEKIASDGQFEDRLLSQSNIVTDEFDYELCPDM